MKISLNKIKKYVQIPAEISDQALIELIGSRLVEIEEVIDLAPKYRGIFIVKVLKADPIEGTHLHLCEIDAGAHNAEFDQLENGLVQVVCGAPNVHVGMLAVWIAPGAIVPETYGNEDFKLGARKLRGYLSQGMLAACDELDLGGGHEGIVEIEPGSASIGDEFAKAFDLNDLILDVENKSLTHRPDCFGLIGFAREVAGILGLSFEEPAVFSQISQKLSKQGKLAPTIKIADPQICPRYSCAVFDLPNNQPSKYLTADAVFLAKAGMRAIDPIVDLTNILMLETGQPLHAFDYDKLVAVSASGQTSSPNANIIVRLAKDGETLQLIDGKTITCADFDILITANNVPVALAGAMGGKNTEIDASTKRVILESATFSLYHLRKTQMAHGIFSEAITRFTKGQPATLCGAVLEEALVRLDLKALAVADEWPKPTPQSVVKIATDSVNQLLGTSYNLATISQTLENVGFQVKSQTKNATELTVTAPAWRTDIHAREDIVEEVGRLLGYDNIPLTLPERPFLEAEIDRMVALKEELRAILSDRLAMHEVLTYSFVNRQLLEKVGQDARESYEIVNSISPDLECFRQQIVPSLLDKIRENIKAGYQDFTLYETNQVSRRAFGLTAEKTPVLETHLGLVMLNDFYELKARLLALFSALKLKIEYSAPSPEALQEFPYFEPKRSAEVFVDGKSLGVFGEVKLSVLKKFKLSPTIAVAEFKLDQLLEAPREYKLDLQFSKFPFVERDLTLKVASDLAYWRVRDTLEHVLSKNSLLYSVEPGSIYQSAKDLATKNLSFHLKFTNPEKTLASDEISAIMEEINVASAQIGATIV